jgi:hypothetical protein
MLSRRPALILAVAIPCFYITSIEPVGNLQQPFTTESNDLTNAQQSGVKIEPIESAPSATAIQTPDAFLITNGVGVVIGALKKVFGY